MGAARSFRVRKLCLHCFALVLRFVSRREDSLHRNASGPRPLVEHDFPIFSRRLHRSRYSRNCGGSAILDANQSRIEYLRNASLRDLYKSLYSRSACVECLGGKRLKRMEPPAGVEPATC